MELLTVPLGKTALPTFGRALQQELGGVLVLPNKVLRKNMQRYNIASLSMDALAGKILELNGINLPILNRRSQELVIGDLVAYIAEQKQDFLEKMASTCQSLGQEGKMDYFQTLYKKPGFIKAMTSLLGQLARSGATVGELRRAVEALEGRELWQQQKDRDILLCYALYKQYLANNGWLDLEGRYSKAIELLEQQQVRLPFTAIYVSDYISFTGLEIKLLEALAKHCRVVIALPYDKSGRENTFAASASTYDYLASHCEASSLEPVDLDLTPEAKEIQRQLHKGASTMEPKAIICYSFDNADKELRFILTQVKERLQAGVAPRTITIALKDFSAYEGLERIAAEYGVPLTLSRSAALAVQPLVEFFQLAFQSALWGKEGAKAYLALLQCSFGQLLLPYSHVAHGLAENTYFTSQKQVVDHLAAALDQQDLEGDHQLLNELNQFIKDLPSKASVAEYYEQAVRLKQLFQVQVTLGRLYQEGQLYLEDLRSGLLSLQEQQKALDILLQDYKDCGKEKEKISLQEWLSLWQEAVSQLEITLERGNPQGVLVTEVVNILGTTSEYLYILGLREGLFPSVRTENWVYNDQERADFTALGIELTGTAQAYAEDAYYFAVAISSFTKELCLSWYVDDDGGVSPYFSQLQKIFPTLQVLHDPAKGLASVEEWLRLGKGCSQGDLEQVLGSEALKAAQVDQLRREQGADSIYNGNLAGAPALSQQLEQRLGHCFSASALEAYAKCPFAYLTGNLWRQYAQEEQAEELKSITKGDILHNTVAEFLKNHLHENLAFGPSNCGLEGKNIEQRWQAYEQELKAIFQEQLQKYGAAKGLDKSYLWPVEEYGLWRMIMAWLNTALNEALEADTLRAVALELPFGPGCEEEQGLKVPYVGVQLSNGRHVGFRGRIDKLEAYENNYFVFDYKTNNTPSSSSLIQGLDLQMPVYLLALDRLLQVLEQDKPKGRRIGGYSYYSFTKEERKNNLWVGPELESGITRLPYKKRANKDVARPLLEELGCLDSEERKEALAQLYSLPWQEGLRPLVEKILIYYLEAMYKGDFSFYHQVGACTDYCKFKDICRNKQLAAEGVDKDE